MKRVLGLIALSIFFLSGCNPSSGIVTTTPDSILYEYPAEFRITEMEGTPAPNSKGHTISGELKGWLPCTGPASLVPPQVQLIGISNDTTLQSYQREFVFESLPKGQYELWVGCMTNYPYYSFPITVYVGDLYVEIILPFNSPSDVAEVFGCLDCPATPTP